jgi:hypothetical protein
VNKNNKVVIYGLYDPRPGRKEVYIGSSCRMKSRFSGHISSARSELVYYRSFPNHYLYKKDKWISELLVIGMLPKLVIYCEVDKKDAPQAERDAIQMVRAIRGKKFVMNVWPRRVLRVNHHRNGDRSS